MKPPRYFVSDKAVIRHLELAEGLNVNAVRRKIRRKVELAEGHPEATAVISGGRRYVLENGVVTTVTPASILGKRSRRKRRKGRG